MLRKVNELAPDNTRGAADALALLERTHQQHPTDGDVLTALVSIDKALRCARELVVINPGDAGLRSLVSDLEKKAAHGFSLGVDLD
jgi:hypothetical protein